MKIILYIISFLLITNLGAAATSEQREQFVNNCNEGDTLACYNMGLMYQYGDGVKKNDAIALNFYLKTCDNNFYQGCSDAALIYEESSSVKQDMKKAFKLYTKACGGDDAFACHNLGIYYSQKDSKAMKKISIALYDKACDGGYALSCIYLGRYYRDSKSLLRDYKKAKEKFNLACEENNYLGCKELRILTEAGY